MHQFSEHVSNIGNKVGFDKKIAIISIVSTFVWMIVVHGMRLFSLAYSHDSIFIDRTADFGWQIEIGRYAQPLYQTITGGITNPLFSCCLSAVFIAGTVLCLARLYSLKSPIFIIGMSGCLVASQPVVTLCGVYIEHFDVFMLSLLLASVSAWLLFEKKTIQIFLISAFSLAASVALYQTFAAAFAGLVFMRCMIDLLKGASSRATVLLIVYSAAVAACGAIMYIVGMKASLAIAGVQLATTYNSVNSVFSMNFSSFISLISGCYTDYLRYFFSLHGFNTPLVSASNALILLVFIIVAVKSGLKEMIHPGAWVMAAALFMLLPLAFNCGYVLSGGYAYEVTRAPFVLSYVLLFWILDRIKPIRQISEHSKRYQFSISAIGTVCILAVLWNGAVYAQGYYVLRLNTINATEQTVNRIIDRIETTDGYVVGKTPVVFVGKLNDNVLASFTPSGFERYYETECRDYPGDPAMTYGLTIQPYFSFIMNYPINVCLDNDGRYSEIIDSEIVDKMEEFPANTSCKMIGDVMVVKLSNTRNSPVE